MGQYHFYMQILGEGGNTRDILRRMYNGLVVSGDKLSEFQSGAREFVLLCNEIAEAMGDPGQVLAVWNIVDMHCQTVVCSGVIGVIEGK